MKAVVGLQNASAFAEVCDLHRVMTNEADDEALVDVAFLFDPSCQAPRSMAAASPCLRSGVIITACSEQMSLGCHPSLLNRCGTLKKKNETIRQQVSSLTECCIGQYIRRGVIKKVKADARM